MKATVKRHSVTKALVWFPNEGNTGIVIQAAEPWKVGMTYSRWNPSDMEESEYEIEIKLKRKEK